MYGQPKQTATVNLIKDRLIDKGLIEKEKNASDQRVVYVKLSPSGAKLKEQARKLVDELIINLSEEQANQLNDLLEVVRVKS